MRDIAHAFFLPFATALPIALAGCSSSQAFAIDAFAQEYCAYVMPCCGNAAAQDPDTCQKTVASWKSFGFDPSLTSACLTAMKQAAATTDFCTTLGAAMAPCDAVFAGVPSSGTVQPGGACTTPGDCASVSGGVAACQRSSSGASTGTCKQVRRGLAGDAPCSSEQYAGITTSEGAGGLPNVSYTCHDFDGVFCDFTTNTCEPFPAPGQTCDPNGDNCGPFASCQSAGNATSCVADLGPGATCNPSANAIDDVQCDRRTTRCRALTSTCTPFLASGSPCTSSDECEGACVAGKCATALEAQLCTTSSASFKPASVPIRPLAPRAQRSGP